MRVLIVEDEEAIVRFLSLELAHEGYEVSIARDGRTGLQEALEQDYDILLLDIMLPELNGVEVLRRLRRRKQTPVIMLTARDAVTDKVMGLDAGANDYLTKPFHIEELLARMRAITRLHEGVQEDTLTAGGLSMHIQEHAVMLNELPVNLTKTEYDLLEYLLRHKNAVLTRGQLISAVWGYDYVGDSNIVDVYIRYLRAKTGGNDGTYAIETIRGGGYALREKKQADEK